MQRALVAGGAGFIGSHLCEKLLNDGYAVTAVDNLITGSEKNIEHLKSNPNFSFVNQDISIGNLKLDIGNLKFIFHLASPASPNAKSPNSYINHPLETLRVNSLGTERLLELAKKDGARFLFASTSEIYGDPTVSPQPETYFGNVNPNGVRSVYDEAKRYGEAITMAYGRTYGVDVRIIRIFNTYGPHMQKDDGRVVSNFIVQALNNSPITLYGDGSQTRSFCYVDDMVDGFCRAMFSENTNREVFNIGNPDERTVAELATIIKEAVGSSSEIITEDLPEDDPKKRRPDITKAKSVLGWEPKVNLSDGLAKTIEYFKTV